MGNSLKAKISVLTLKRDISSDEAKVIKEALDKQTPKKPVLLMEGFSFTACPVCGTRTQTKYCPECGQCLDREV